MAANTTELILKFRGDSGDLKSTMAQVRAELSQVAKTQEATNKSELSTRQQLAAVQSLQKQRSAALISQWKEQERAAKSLATGVQPLSTNLQKITNSIEALRLSSATLQGPLGSVAGRLGTLGSVAASAGGAVGALANPIGLVVAALVVASAITAKLGQELFDLTRHAADFQGKMFDLSQATGVQVETLSALEVLARQTGGSIDSLAASLGIFQRHLEDAEDPSSKIAATFEKLGVEVSDTENALRQTLARLSAMPEGFRQTAIALELFGRGGKQVLAILKETNGDLDGAIQRFRELGILIDTDAARAADKFNDQLALLEFQMRALTAEATRELIPAFLGIVRAVSDLVSALRPLITSLGQVAGPVVSSASHALRGLGVAVAGVTGDYLALAEAVKQAREEIAKDIPALNVPGPAPVPLPGPRSQADIAAEAVKNAEAVVSAAKRSATEQNQILDELFQKGRLRREQETLSVISSNRKVLEAEKARIDTLIEQKKQLSKALDFESDEYKKTADEIAKLHQERLDKESSFEVQSRAIRLRAGKERADSLRDQVKNETEIVLGELDKQIKATDELGVIEQLEQAKIDARRASLEEQKRIGFLTVEAQRDIDNQLTALGQEADQLRDDQQRRRIEKEQEAAERIRQIKLGEIDTLLQLQQIGGERLIDLIKSLADARVLTEEEAARRILQVRLDLIDQEIQSTESKLKAAAGISDVDERIRTEAELNNQLRILIEERKTIQAQGNRDIEEKRREDIENERRYADELIRIRRQITGIELDSARTVIGLMILSRARLRDVRRAQLNLAIADERDRHQQELDSIQAQRQENAEAAQTQAQKNERTAELNRLEEAEAERHRLEMERIRLEGEKAKALAGPGGGFAFGLDTGQLVDLANGVQSFADVATVAFSAVGAAVNGLAQGVGNLVQQWVLMGNQADLSMKKVLATVLASVAAQAAVQAIMFLAYGIASLTPWGAAIFGPAAPWFKAAALMAGIAAVAGGIGRAVAGNSFAAGGGETQGPQAPAAPEDRDRTIRERRTGGAPDPNRLQPIIIDQTVKIDGEVVERNLIKRFQRNGELRSTLRRDLLGEANG